MASATARPAAPKVTKIGKGAGSSQSNATPVGVFQIAKVSIMEFLADNCLYHATAIAYNVLLSIFPLILAGLTIFSLVATQDTLNSLTDQIVKALGGSAGAAPAGSTNIGDVLRPQITQFLARVKDSGLILGAVTLVTTLYSGAGVFGSIIFAVNQAWNLISKRNPVLQIGLQFLLLFSLGALFLLASVANVAASFIQGSAKDLGLNVGGVNPLDNPVTQILFSVIAWIIPIIIFTLIFAIIYKVAPDTKANTWRAALVSGAIIAIVFQLLQQIIPLYLSIFNAKDGYAKTYGSLGTLILFLFIVYISAAVVLLGAEINSAIIRGGAPKPVRVPAGETRVVGPVAVTEKGDHADVEEVDEPGASDTSDLERDPGAAAREVGGTRKAQPTTPRPVIAAGPVRPAGLPDRIAAYLVLAGIFIGGVLGALRGNPRSKPKKK